MEIKKFYDCFRYDIPTAHLLVFLLKDVDKFNFKK